MPKKKITKKKAARERIAFGPDEENPSRPTKTEWNAMDSSMALVTTKYTYKCGDDFHIRSGDDSNNAWIGRLRSVRRRMVYDGPEFWALVQWYFSPSDIKELPKFVLRNREIESFSINERILSDMQDIIPAGCLKGPIYVHQYSEESLNPPAIHAPTQYFVRYNMTDPYATAALSPYPGENACVCHTPYNPFPEQPSVAKLAIRQYYARQSGALPTELEKMGDYWHFCPRPTCSKWFHESCLLHRAKTQEIKDFISTPAVQYLAVDPDHARPYPKLERYTYEKPPRGKMASDGTWTLAELLEKEDLPLPKSLIKVAAMPIIRRAGEGSFSTAGNVADVILARRMVYQAFEGWQNDLERLMRRLDDSWFLHGDPAHLNFVWRYLCSVRILASPRDEYWDDLYENLKVHCDSRPLLHCPECGKGPEESVAI